MTCDDSDALTRDVVARVGCVASESHPRHSVVDLRYLISGSVMILVYPPPKGWIWVDPGYEETIHRPLCVWARGGRYRVLGLGCLSETKYYVKMSAFVRRCWMVWSFER